MPRHPAESVDLSAYASFPTAAFAAIHHAALHVDLACFGSYSPSGETRQTPIRCRKRPARRACQGLLQVRRRDVPDAIIEWTCPCCGHTGQITAWEDGQADLRHVQRPKESARAQPVTINSTAHAALRNFARGDPRWATIVYGASVKGRDVLIQVPAANRSDCARSLLVGAHQVPGSTQSKRLVDVAKAIDPSCENLTAPDLGGSDQMREAAADSLGGELAEILALDPDIETKIAGDIGLPGLEIPTAGRGKPKRGRSRRSTAGGTHRIMVTLRDVKPPVWRRIVVPSNIELPDLHEVLQTAMGWLDCHLHAFTLGRESFSPHRDDLDPIGEDSHGVTLRELAPSKGNRLIYEYDFGDGWRHDILVEDVSSERRPSVQCLKGKRACPPEDCGGPWGYAHLLKVLADPNHEEHQDMAEWCGKELDPERFNLGEVNAALSLIR